jgi:hypothetical protein
MCCYCKVDGPPIACIAGVMMRTRRTNSRSVVKTVQKHPQRSHATCTSPAAACLPSRRLGFSPQAQGPLQGASTQVAASFSHRSRFTHSQQPSVPAQAFTAERPLRSAARHCITRTGVVIGIDLGTSNVAVAVIEDGLPRILPDANGRVTSPSIVAFRKVCTVPYNAC